MAVITLSREYGSGGGALSQMIHNSLRYKLADKQLIEQVLRTYGLTTLDEVYHTTHNIWSRLDSQTMELVRMLNNTIRAFSKHDGTLIIGRGGFVVLQDYQNVLNVFLRAPFDYRVRMVMDTEGVHDILEAEEQVRQSDKARVSFLQIFHDIKPDSPQNFNLVIDTSRIPLHMAASLVIEAARNIDLRKPDPARSTASIEVDPVLGRIVEETLSKQA